MHRKVKITVLHTEYYQELAEQYAIPNLGICPFHQKGQVLYSDGDDKLEEAVKKVFDLRPTAIIRDLDLRKPIYRQLAAYGHMGREDLGVSWEKTDRVEALKAAVL